jgi:HNH endonuclease
MKQKINHAYIQQTCFYLDNAEGISVLSAPIPKRPGYWAGVDGSIFSFKKNRFLVLKPHDNGLGRLQAGIFIDGKLKQMNIARLVAETFLIRPTDLCARGYEKLEINHVDGNPFNNKVANLEWVSRSENQLHAHQVLQAEDFLASKFSPEYQAARERAQGT